MEISDEYKSLWPMLFSISESSDSDQQHLPRLGPLNFNPSRRGRTVLLHVCPSRSPKLPPLLPLHSLSTFPSSDHLPSSISSNFGPSNPDSSTSALLCHNNLLLLRLPGTRSFLAFFPTGENSDQVGFLTLAVDRSKITVEDGVKVVKDSSSKHKLTYQRILKLSVSPISNNSTIGYLIACTMYGIQWYSVGFDVMEKPSLDFIAFKLFKSCVVDACWSPHLPEECLVLLEKGELYLFDLDDCSNNEISRSKFCGKRMKVSWKDSGSLGRGGWLGCEFSWHPRIFVVAQFRAVFLLDFRGGENVTTCLLEIHTSAISTPAPNDRFVAFSKASSDGFHFVVASEYRIILFDVRKVMMPLLQWAHDIPSPSYINVLSLSDLRSSSKDEDCYKWASKFGKCIVMGSFWECQFNIFCYGPRAAENNASEILKLGNTLCAWGLPSELSLSGRECNCGSCLLREEFWKESLPPWVDWRQKKEIVIGFGILDKDFGIEFSQPGGFTLIRLMSSGKIESQRYFPSLDFKTWVKEPLKEYVCDFHDSLLFADSDMEYKYPKRFEFLKLDYLSAYMKDDLDTVLFGKVEEHRKVPSRIDNFHESFCEKLKARGLPIISYAASNMPLSSIHEATLSKIQTPFPDLPTPVLLTIYEFFKGNASKFSANSEIMQRCSEVIKIANEIAPSSSPSYFCNDNVSLLGKDGDRNFKNIESMNLIRLHKSSPKTYGSDTEDSTSEDSACYDERFTTFVQKTSDKDLSDIGAEMDGPQLFDSLSPIKLKFDGTMKFGSNRTFILFKEHYKRFLGSYDCYQQYLRNFNLHKQEG